MKENNGITLIAIIVTVIVLLILAAVSINFLVGDSGILTKSEAAKEEHEINSGKEDLVLKISNAQMTLSENSVQINLKNVLDIIKQDNEIFSVEKVMKSDPADAIDYAIVILKNYDKYQYKIENNLLISYLNKNKITENNKLAINIDTSESNKMTIFANNSQAIDYILLLDNKFYAESQNGLFTIMNIESSKNKAAKIIAIDKNGNQLAQKNINFDVSGGYSESSWGFDKFIYFDSINGSDTLGDGTKYKPFKTLNKLTENGIVGSGYSYGIMLLKGEYNFSGNLLTLACTKSMSYIGEIQNTILNFPQLGTDYTGVGNNNYSVDFYRLIWKSNISTPCYNYINTQNNMNIHNVVFNITGLYQHGYIAPRGTNNITISNSILTSNVGAFIRTSMTSGYVRATNCYGAFTSGYGTSDSNWNYQTNNITSTPQYDSSTYKINASTNTWQNCGTGTNIDGSIANIGVYGAQYSWDNLQNYSVTSTNDQEPVENNNLQLVATPGFGKATIVAPIDNNVDRYIIIANGEYKGSSFNNDINVYELSGNVNLKITAINKDGSSNVSNSMQVNIDSTIEQTDIIADSYIYVDSINGSDESGNGTNNLPYKTLAKVASNGLNSNITYGIVLNNGSYYLDDEMFTTGCTKIIKIIGKKENTTLNLKQIGTNYTSGGNGQYTIEIYRTICTSTDSTLNHINTINSMNFYNVVFNITGAYGDGYLAPRGGSVTLNNCTLTSNVPAFIRTSMTSGYIRLTNCYGGFNSGYGTANTNWNYANNIVTSTPIINNATYEITDTINKWENSGNGFDLDGTIADIGVYGGTYSWNY